MANNASERLLAIVLLLLDARRPLTRSEIRSAVGDYPANQDRAAFERMFERDKEYLRAMGIPIESVPTTDTEGVGYQLARSDAFLKGIELEPAERFVLALASRMWDESTWGHDSLNALRKLEIAGEFTTSDEVRAPVLVSVNSGVLTKLLDAADTRRRVQFLYRRSGMPTAEKRSVEPWGVVATRGQWYLVGHDTERAATRVFRLSRIEGAVSLKRPPDAYKIPEGVDFQSLVKSTFPGPGPIAVTVRVDPGEAPRLHWLASQEDADVLTLSGVDPDRIIYEVLADSPQAEVLGPPDFRDRVVAALTTIVNAQAVT
ncbi:MAG: WYL domain-containing protein, partial [Actinomycetes bacterium]